MVSIELFSNTREVVLQVGFSLRVWPSLLSLPPSRSPAAAGPFKGPRAPFGSSQSTMASKRRQDGRRRSRTGQQQRQEAVNPAGASGPLALGARPAAARSFSGAVASATFVVAAAAVVVSVVLPPAAECAPAAAAAAAACQNNPYCFYGGEKRMSQMRYTRTPSLCSSWRVRSAKSFPNFPHRLKKSGLAEEEEDGIPLTESAEKRMSQMRLKKMSQMRLKKMSQMRLKRMSQMRFVQCNHMIYSLWCVHCARPSLNFHCRLKKSDLAEEEAEDEDGLPFTESAEKRMSQMRLKKMSQMRLKKMSQMRLKKMSQMRLKKDGEGEAVGELVEDNPEKRMSQMRLKKDVRWQPG